MKPRAARRIIAACRHIAGYLEPSDRPLEVLVLGGSGSFVIFAGPIARCSIDLSGHSTAELVERLASKLEEVEDAVAAVVFRRLVRRIK